MQVRYQAAPHPEIVRISPMIISHAIIFFPFGIPAGKFRSIMSENDTSTIQFFGAMWCGDTRRARSWLDRHQIDYDWIDVDKDEQSAELVKKLNNGLRSIPTILFADGSRLVEPTTARLEEHARKIGIYKEEAVAPPVFPSAPATPL